MPRRTKNAEVAAQEKFIEDHVAARIRLRRGLLGMSQSDLARSLGITFQQVQKYERGSNRVSVGKLYKLAEVLDVPLTFFFDDLNAGPTGRRPLDSFGFGEDQSPILSRRELDLLRAWKSAKPDVADAVASLLRAMMPSGEDEPDSDSDVTASATPRQVAASSTAPTASAGTRGRRGPGAKKRSNSVWSPNDIKPAKGH